MNQQAIAKAAQGYENDVVMITHGDCIEDAKYVEEQIRERFGIENIIVNGIGSVIGSHTGAGVVAVFFMGKIKTKKRACEKTKVFSQPLFLL